MCDPTLLLTCKDEIFNEYKDINEKYILLYIFQRLTPLQEEELIKCAMIHEYKIINLMRKEIAPYADVHVINTPDTFCKYIKSAQIVVTDTYHGTLFSLLFEKHFVVINRNKVTVNDIMNQLDLRDRLTDDSNFRSNLEKPFDYETVSARITELRHISTAFLLNQMEDGIEKL